jgi:hypothetical protein
MVCFYTELRGRAPKGILEQIDPLEIILALEPPSPNSTKAGSFVDLPDLIQHNAT